LIALPAAAASAAPKPKNGPLVVASYAGFGGEKVRTDVLAVPEMGKPVKLFSKPGLGGAFAISPDGKRFVYQTPASTGSPYVGFVRRPGKQFRISAATEMTFPGDAVFAPDGKSVYYTRTTVTNVQIGLEYESSLKQYFLASRKTRTIDRHPLAGHRDRKSGQITLPFPISKNQRRATRAAMRSWAARARSRL
jgi:hypothetical protein